MSEILCRKDISCITSERRLSFH